MTLKDIKGWLKQSIDADIWSISSQPMGDKSITIYSSNPVAYRLPMNGLTVYKTKAISVLVHWNKNPTETEEKANEVFTILSKNQPTINGSRVVKFDMRTDEPVFLGTDEEGIYEYVINLVIYYAST